MRRTKIDLTIAAPPGGSAARLCDVLRDAGYTVEGPTFTVGSQQGRATLLAPYGEIDARQPFIGTPRDLSGKRLQQVRLRR